MRWRMYLRDRGAMLTEISGGGGGGDSSIEFRGHHTSDGRRGVRQSGKGWMSTSTSLLNSSSVVVGERH